MAATALLIAFCAAAASPAAAAATGPAIHCAAGVGPGAARVGPSSSPEPQWQTSRDPANPDRVILVSPFDCDEPSPSPSGSTSTEPTTTSTAPAGTTSAPVTGTTAPATPGPAGPAKVPPPASQATGALSWTGAGPLLLLAAIALGLIAVGGLLYWRARAARRERA